jgi:hypothetical protein
MGGCPVQVALQWGSPLLDKVYKKVHILHLNQNIGLYNLTLKRRIGDFFPQFWKIAKSLNIHWSAPNFIRKFHCAPCMYAVINILKSFLLLNLHKTWIFENIRMINCREIEFEFC